MAIYKTYFDVPDGASCKPCISSRHSYNKKEKWMTDQDGISYSAWVILGEW